MMNILNLESSSTSSDIRSTWVRSLSILIVPWFRPTNDVEGASFKVSSFFLIFFYFLFLLVLNWLRTGLTGTTDSQNFKFTMVGILKKMNFKLTDRVQWQWPFLSVWLITTITATQLMVSPSSEGPYETRRNSLGKSPEKDQWRGENAA